MCNACYEYCLSQKVWYYVIYPTNGFDLFSDETIADAFMNSATKELSVTIIDSMLSATRVSWCRHPENRPNGNTDCLLGRE